jgi:hypothetical protein
MMSDIIYTDDTSWHQPYARSLPLSRYAYLQGYGLPSDTEPLTAYFGTDSFLPDFEHPARMNRIPLIKGAAIQHNLPGATASTIDIKGWCRTPADKNVILRLFYSNYPELPAPYPTDFLLIRKEYYKLGMPDGRQRRVRFADTPEFTSERGEQGRVIWTVTLRFYPVVDDDDLEYLG